MVLALAASVLAVAFPHGKPDGWVLVTPAKKCQTCRKHVFHLSRDRVIERMIRKRFGRAHDDTAVCVAAAESTGDRTRPYHFAPWAHSPTDDHGLFQIHGGLRTYGRRIYHVWFNLNVAWRMSSHGRNWWQWTGTYGRGICHGLS